MTWDRHKRNLERLHAILSDPKIEGPLPHELKTFASAISQSLDLIEGRMLKKRQAEWSHAMAKVILEDDLDNPNNDPVMVNATRAVLARLDAAERVVTCVKEWNCCDTPNIPGHTEECEKALAAYDAVIGGKP